MRICAFLSLVIFCLSLCVPSQTAWAAVSEDGWESIEPGIDYQEFLVSGPNRVFVARMDRGVEKVILDTSIAQGRLAYGLEKVSDMFVRYDDAINFVEYPSDAAYEYGFRNQVVVAINGSFLEPNTTIPYSGMIQSGWYAKRYKDFSGAAFGWKYDVDVTKRQAFIGDCVYHKVDKQYIRNTESGVTLPFNGINISRPSNSMILYTSHYDATTRTASDGVEVLVEMKRASLLLTEPRGAKGIVVRVREDAGSTIIPFDHIVLSAHGTAAANLLNWIEEGDEIEVEVDQEITSYTSDCGFEVTIPNWVKTYAGITGDHTYLKDGLFMPHPTKNYVLEPRTAIAYNDDYIYFIVVDGRQPDVSVGMTYGQLAAFSVDNLEAKWGLTMDSGGSSTMVINGLVMNNPSDPCARRIYLPMIPLDRPDPPEPGSTTPYLIPSADDASAPILVCERRVANGVMMIVLQDKQSSTLFEPGFTVLNQIGAQVRLGPGTNYALLATLNMAQEGVILHQISNLDGIYAKGAFWWKVDFGSLQGWVNQDSLILKPVSGSFN
jgi:hypothetical protein